MQNDPGSIWFSSGTAALIAALEAVGARGKAVALPPNICPNVIVAVLAVQAEPWFVDIEPNRQGLNPVTLATVIERVSCVIAVHAYGAACRIDEIATIAAAAGVALIEDCAQADGATYNGRPTGHHGDIAVYSFGTGKIVDAGGGGVAAVRNPIYRKPMIEGIKNWQEFDNSAIANTLSSQYKFLYNNFYPDALAAQTKAFGDFLVSIASLFVGRLESGRESHLMRARGLLDQKVAIRRKKHDLYLSKLSDSKHCQCVALPDGAVPWRFNVLLPEDMRDLVFRALLARGIKASTWYPDITRFLPNNPSQPDILHVARSFDRRLLNFWIDDSISETQIDRSIAVFLRECEIVEGRRDFAQ
jgi:dTDP-4-amino-4,6-dideoxygalactose transaminase